MKIWTNRCITEMDAEESVHKSSKESMNSSSGDESTVKASFNNICFNKFLSLMLIVLN